MPAPTNLSYVVLQRNFAGAQDLIFQESVSGYTGITYLATPQDTINQSFNRVTIVNRSIADKLRFSLEALDRGLNLNAKGDGIVSISPGVSFTVTEQVFKRLRLYFDGAGSDTEIILEKV